MPVNELAAICLEIGAIKLNPMKPFQWASGNVMPVYNDNRLLLSAYEHRTFVAKKFLDIIRAKDIKADMIAGAATAGIAPAVTLANLMECRLAYVRPDAKQHGMKNQIEGADPKGAQVVVVEDLISTGGSVLKVIDAIREAGGTVQHCFCIFSYDFAQAKERFEEANCEMHSLLTFPTLLEHIKTSSRFTPGQIEILESWYQSPFSWTPPTP